MSKTELVEHPGTAQPKSGINTRKAEAGLIKLRNPKMSMQEALEQAGYSPSTARAPSRNNLNERQCIEEAWKLQPDPKPARILRKARVLLEKKLDLTLANEDDLRAAKHSDIARMVDTTERAYGGADDSPERSARTFVERARWLADLFAEMRKRGIDITADMDMPLDAVVIDAEPADDESNLELPPKESERA